ncbi:MAG: Z1 domain-containing protein [Cardiobacteriaceae bacterium]|nr:Z1 domain-containing protein [Cardiobacteriaceae bacterium]
MLQTYLNQLNPPELAQSVKNTTTEFLEKLDHITPKKSQNVLLVGNVQSGKTAQVFGIASALAQRDYQIFLYLTTDSMDLQMQTLNRAKSSLSQFTVLDEHHDNLLDDNLKQNKPIMIVIKKNAKILQRWRNVFQSKAHLKGYPLIIIDDEADAASLNTHANQAKERSTINHHLNDIKNACCQSLFIQLTATPQALLLQNQQSNGQPEFVHYFQAGENYVGGKFVFSEPPSYIVRFVDNELMEMKDGSAEISDGVLQALQAYLLTCTEFKLCGKTNCNFALHPSIKIADHRAFADKIKEHLNDLVQSLNHGDNLASFFQVAYHDLKRTKPDIHHFEDLYAQLCSLLEQEKFTVLVLNSQTENDFQLDNGFNIIVGGNVIGRGLTIPKLQTVYYSRTAKKPNADTFWQHSRIFGYDRDKALLRLFLPCDVYRFFVTLNQANDLLIEQICSDYHKIQMIYPKNINPTRQNVLVSSSLNHLVGGVNYFPSFPDEHNLSSINDLIGDLDDGLHETDSENLLHLLQNLGEYSNDDWDKEKIIASILALQHQRPSFKSRLLIKRNRQLSKNTGTMLSENDRKLGEKYPNDLLLTLYHVQGAKERGWSGQDFWLPNIKLPHKGAVYWSIRD